MIYKIFILFILLVFNFNVFAQNKNAITSLNNQNIQIIGKDTFYVTNVPPVYIFPPADLKNRRELMRYQRLVYNVRIVYPYALIAKKKLEDVNTELNKLKSEKDKKIYLDKVEIELKKQFEADLKNLTITQGKILVKLIDRETGNTTYTWVKELRGSFQAFFWQSLARLVGSNLRMKYDPTGDDKAIEDIIIMIDTGQL
jgi:hypothetical protein